MRYTFLFFFALSLNCFSQSEQGPKTNSNISTKTFGSRENGWGYDIFRNEKLYVHQPYIPAVTGNHGFKTETEAKRVADLMKYKMEKNILPPTISIKELDSLKIKYQ